MDNELKTFSQSFTEARRKFVEASKASACDVATFEFPGGRSAFGEEMSIDVCRSGAKDADVVLLTMSGTHGGEGFCGSAIQTHVMRAGLMSHLPDGVAVVQIHAVNPFGMAHYIRTNEDNVDLNRNWIDFRNVPATDPIYDKVFGALPPARAPSPELLNEHLDAFAASIEKYGRWEVDNALSSGQFHRPDGIGFGGVRPAWSRTILEKILSEMIGPARHVVYIDWHSLLRIGDGRVIYLCFNQTGDHLFDRVGTWWGHSNIARETVNAQWRTGTSAGARRPARHGLAMWGIQQRLARSADLAGAVVEFCTQPDEHRSPDVCTAYETICERYLQASRDFLSPAGSEAVDMLREATCPKSRSFRIGAIKAGSHVFENALRGAAEWSKENVAARPGHIVLSSEFA
ncbi:MAG TPA: DUF2817 domain-containing protein [Woeseiaceae bacterium]|nr:DUF2817 domain-containing protein [Woeseiaceae bacterium]